MEKLRTRIGHALRRYLLAGLAALFPAAVTFYLLWAIFRFSDGLLGKYLAVHIPGLGLLLTLVTLLLVGFLSTRFFGGVVFPTLESWFSRLPVVRSIYPAAKQLTEFLFGAKGRPPSFQKVVLVEYPGPGLYSLAFVTHEEATSVTGISEVMLTLLIPVPPSPFTGPIIFVSQKDVTPLSMSVENAIKLIVSGGVVSSALEAVPPLGP